MASELIPANRTPPGTEIPDAHLITRAADLVYLAEASHLGMFRLTSLLTMLGSGLSICFAAVTKTGITTLTVCFALAGAGFGSVTLLRARQAYIWFRRDRLRQLTPLALAVPAVLLTGAASPAWWLALPVLWTIAVISSAPLALLAASLTGCSYLAGTALAGQPLVQSGNAGIPAGAVALIGYTFVCWLVAELLARFILHLNQLTPDPQPRPRLFVPNLATEQNRVAGDPEPLPPAATTLCRLSARELQVAMLLRDGLTHAEIAAALGITTRQVERHITNARDRAKAKTTGELLAMLVTGRLTPSQTSLEPTDQDEGPTASRGRS